MPPQDHSIQLYISFFYVSDSVAHYTKETNVVGVFSPTITVSSYTHFTKCRGVGSPARLR